MASPFIGRQIDIGIGKETVRGTPVAPTFFLPAITKETEDMFELAKDAASRGVIETDTDAKVTKRWSEGNIEMLVRDKSIGLLLLSLFGKVVTTADSPELGVNTHDFTVEQIAQHQSLTIALKHPVENIRFALSMITSMEFVVELANFVRTTVGFMGKKGVSAVDTPAYSVENEFIPQHVTVKFADTLAGLDAASAVNAKTVNLTFNKNIESDDIVGTVDPNDFLNKQFQAEGSLELLYEDTTQKAKAIAGTPKAMRIELKNTDVTIGATSNPTIQFDFAKVILEEWSRTGANDDITRQTLGFMAYFSIADSKMVATKLINTEISY
jgi:hypothetical protein